MFLINIRHYTWQYSMSDQLCTQQVYRRRYEKPPLAEPQIALGTRNTFCWTRSLSNATFSFLITWRSSSSKSAPVYKISSESDDFSLRYGDISILKMATVRHLGIVYHHTRPPTKSLLLATAACQISCQSDTQIWKYSYLNFSHIWLEMPIQTQKWGFWGTLDS